MMRSDALNSHCYPVRTEMIAMKHIQTSQFCSTDESKLKEFLVDKTLQHSWSTDKDESKSIIVNKFSTEEDESECVINKQKDSNNETEYEESSVTYYVLIYSNVFECGRNVFNRIIMSYEQVCMANPRDNYYTKMLETLIYHNDCCNGPISSEKILQAFGRAMA